MFLTDSFWTMRNYIKARCLYRTSLTTSTKVAAGVVLSKETETSKLFHLKLHTPTFVTGQEKEYGTLLSQQPT